MFETPKGDNQEITAKDLSAADELIAENPLLANNDRVKFLQENAFVTEDGRQLDPGNFLQAVLARVESSTTQLSEEDISEVVARNMVTHSEPTDLENLKEDRPQ